MAGAPAAGAVVGLVTLGLYLLGVNAIALLFAGGAAVMLVQNLRRLQSPGIASIALPFLGLSPAVLTSTVFSLPLLFLTFLKIGAVLYGSGYVLLAFLRADFVTRNSYGSKASGGNVAAELT